MLQKIENPMGLNLRQVDILIAELQPTFDRFIAEPVEFLTLEESGISMEITTKHGKSASYNLEQLKMLKAEMNNPVFNSVMEIS